MNYYIVNDKKRIFYWLIQSQNYSFQMWFGMIIGLCNFLLLSSYSKDTLIDGALSQTTFLMLSLSLTTYVKTLVIHNSENIKDVIYLYSISTRSLTQSIVYMALLFGCAILIDIIFHDRTHTIIAEYLVLCIPLIGIIALNAPLKEFLISTGHISIVSRISIISLSLCLVTNIYLFYVFDLGEEQILLLTIGFYVGGIYSFCKYIKEINLYANFDLVEYIIPKFNHVKLRGNKIAIIASCLDISDLGFINTLMWSITIVDREHVGIFYTLFIISEFIGCIPLGIGRIISDIYSHIETNKIKHILFKNMLITGVSLSFTFSLLSIIILYKYITFDDYIIYIFILYSTFFAGNWIYIGKNIGKKNSLFIEIVYFVSYSIGVLCILFCIMYKVNYLILFIIWLVPESIALISQFIYNLIYSYKPSTT